MKREVKHLLEKACDSLVLSIELFNRPHDCGRISSTLILLDHAFEMLMKAAILQRGGRIRKKRAKQTIGFDACVRKSITDAKIKYLSEEQALVLQAINGLRDAAQHHILEISETQLYIHMQSGVTLFRDILKTVFSQELADHMPKRVLPVSTTPPTDLASLFESEASEIAKLLKPGRRRRVEALARLRPLAILDATIKGEKSQPSQSELNRIGEQISKGKDWTDVFKGVAAVEIRAEGEGPTISLRLSKKQGIPIQLVSEGTPGASVVAVKRVNELDFYSLGAKQLADKLDLTVPKTIAIVDHIGLRNDQNCYKEFRIGKSLFKRYSERALERIKEILKSKSADDIWLTRNKQRA